MRSQRPYPDAPDKRTLLIFGHPTHELALFGTIQRLRPHIAIITDGGGPEREAYSRTALGEIGALELTTFMGFAEDDFYTALLERDVAYFEGVVERIRDEIEAVQPEQIFCDAVEYYNPVHDVTLPMVQAALDGKRLPLYEVPLVYQKATGDDVYEIQRVPESLAHLRAVLDLTESEAAVKRRARDERYPNLLDQAGGDFMGIPAERFMQEEVSIVTADRPLPGEHGRRLRYEWRAEVLQGQGAVDQVITYADHYVPMIKQLLPAS